ncbi:hypothetical protein R3P38DRAFT_3257499 [Favolaschia claudopus]|uniref:F-box domain-containing protein n=1 Tax=Favolaschia claudopus TaxID=2862362 RepID=A0AAW0DCT0_9AGAR
MSDSQPQQDFSIPRLREHIDELSSAIEAQEQILQDLRHRRSDAYRDLNLLVDPMARLALELQSDIFLNCIYDPSPHDTIAKPDPHAPPMVFMAVSRMWRDIALATPRLWAALRIDVRVVIRSLSPSKATLLSIVMSASCWDEFSEQLHHLTFHVAPEADDEDRDDEVHQVLPLSSNAAQFTCLETLTIHREARASPNAPEYVELIRAAPALLECDLRNMVFASHDWPSMVHSSLQQLRLGCPWPWDDESCQAGSSAEILLHLTLPALTGLYVTDFDIEMEGFIAFLMRSSPPLDTLFLNFPESMSQQIMSDCFPHMPRLTSLTLDGTCSFPILLILSSSPNLLPNLRHLTIQPISPDWDLDTIMNVLSARPLKSFRIRHCLSAPDQATIQALLAFSRDHDGLEVSVEYLGSDGSSA